MDCLETIESPAHAYKILFGAARAIPPWHYIVAMVIFCIVLLYNFLEFHFLEDLFTGFRGSPVLLAYNSCSELYEKVASKCQTLHGRYLATPWISSPHFQTTFINFLGRPPVFNYRREIFHASDGGTFALDWLTSSDVSQDATSKSSSISRDDTTPIVVVIPGLTSDSASPYLKHLAFNIAKRGWNVVISNHRGLGGMSVTSDCFYNAGWTEDIRCVVEHLHQTHPMAPLFIVGTSIGANVLVKYLGEDGENVAVAGAVAICSPWDLLIGSRFIGRRLIQKLYDRALTIGLQGYAQLHQPRYSRLANWEGIKKSCSIRDFDTHATCLVGNYETVDTYYRHCSSASFVGRVAVPLLCIGALDDPVCTTEAIPWDECRSNNNVILAMTKHGGHLAFFEGIAGSCLWWVRAVNEFLGILHSSSLMHKRKAQSPVSHSALVESSIDQGPYLSVADGMVTAMGTEPTTDAAVSESSEELKAHNQTSGIILDTEQSESTREANNEPDSSIAHAPNRDDDSKNVKSEANSKAMGTEPTTDAAVSESSEGLKAHNQTSGIILDTEQSESTREANNEPDSSIAHAPNRYADSKNVKSEANSKDVKSARSDMVAKCLSQLSQQNKRSMWLLAYIAILSTWPLMGIAFKFLFRKKLKKFLPANVYK